MIHRSRWTRTLAALFAVWLALVLGDAGFAHHHCPMHDGPLPTAASGAHAGAHGAHGAHGDPSDHGAPAPDGHHGCSCIGACSASSGAVALFASPAIARATINDVTDVTPRGDESASPSQRAPFTLPFANGPPQRIA